MLYTYHNRGDKMKGKDSKKWIFLGVFLIVLTAIASFVIVRFSNRNMDDIEGVSKNINAGGTAEVNITKLSDATLLKIFEKTGFKLATTGKTHTRSTYWKIKTNDGQWVYCVELGNLFKDGSKTAGTGTYWNKTLTKEQKEIIERISVYGFPNVKRTQLVKDNVKDANLSNESIKEYQYMATQVLIWEVQQGWRNGEGVIKDQVLYNLYIKDNDALRKVYKEIATAVKNHDKIPSFTASTESKAPVETLTYDASTKQYTAKFTDDLIADFTKVQCGEGLTCKKSGKTLTVTATGKIKKGSIHLTKEIPSGTTQSLVVLDDTVSQRTMLGTAKISEVNAYLKVSTETLGKLVITKTVEDIPGDGNKKGFKFRVTGPDNYDQKFETNADGKITITNLKYGEYTISEVELNSKYIQPSPKTVKINSTTAVTTTFENILKDTSSIKILKVDAETGEPVAGAHLYVTPTKDNYSKKIDEWDSTLGYHIIDKEKVSIELGKTYYICETKAPDGYEVGECLSFVVSSKEEAVVKSFKDSRTTTKIVKVDENGKKLAGAELKVLTKDGKDVPNCDACEWISDGNDHEIKGLVKGTEYILREVSAPEGYVIASDVKFKPEQGTITMKNTKQEIEIIKKSADGKMLAGAVLKIIDKDKNVVVKPWTTVAGETKNITGLVPGEYYLVEETAPEGYVKAQSVKFELKASDTKKVVTMVDDLTETEFTKTDAVTGEEIPGAHLQILDSDGNKIENCSSCEWVSEAGKKHVVKGLIEGETYKLVETLAPDGYVTAEEVIFVVGESEKVVMENKKTVTKIHKRDTATGRYVEGATLQLLDENGELVDEWVTTDEVKEIRGLKTGVEYTLVEIEAPEDYMIAPEQTFILSSSEGSRDITMYDTELTPVENTAVSSSVIAVIVGAILVVGGAGTVIWTRKKEA